MEEKLNLFIEVSGVEDRHAAQRILEASGGNIDMAMQLYFDGAMGHQGAGDIPPEDIDAALARQLQSEMDAETAAAQVREADDQRVESLYGRGWGVPARETASHFEGFAIGAGHDPKGLQKMFSAPSYRFRGSLDEGCAEAVRSRRLLLLSLNLNEDFRCHALNRDVWKHHDVTPTVQAFFVLMQLAWKKPADGEHYDGACLTYGVEPPIILIIDPRTGRRLETIELSSMGSASEACQTLLNVMSKWPTGTFYGGDEDEDDLNTKDKIHSSESSDVEIDKTDIHLGTQKINPFRPKENKILSAEPASISEPEKSEPMIPTNGEDDKTNKTQTQTQIPPGQALGSGAGKNKSLQELASLRAARKNK